MGSPLTGRTERIYGDHHVGFIEKAPGLRAGVALAIQDMH